MKYPELKIAFIDEIKSILSEELSDWNMFGNQFTVAVEKITKVKYIDCFKYSTEHYKILEKEINIMHDRISVFDNREQAYQAACKLINRDIEYQLHVIRKGEKV